MTKAFLFHCLYCLLIFGISRQNVLENLKNIFYLHIINKILCKQAVMVNKLIYKFKIYLIMKKLIFITLIMLIFPLLTFSQWDIEIINDSTGNSGCDITTDNNGYPHISYRDESHNLYYAHWDGSQWETTLIETPNSVYNGTSIALNETGNPHISFIEGFWYGNQLWHAWWDGVNWQQECVDSLPYDGDAGRYSSIAFDNDGYPHISYTLQNTEIEVSYIKYAYKDGSGWNLQCIDSITSTFTNQFKYTSLALDSNNYPHISYYDYDERDLKYAPWDGSEWQIEKIDSIGNVGKYASIALDNLDYPNIAYQDYTNDGIKYAKWDGATWQIETVESDIGYGNYTSLALDANNRPHISSAKYNEVRFAYWNGTDWQIEVVEDIYCGWTALDIDDDGYCHIVYYNDESQSLSVRYAKRNPISMGIANYLMNENNINIYPNPSKENLIIDIISDNSLEFSAEIIDMQGRKIKKRDIIKEKTEMNISGLPDGIYIIKIDKNEKFIKSEKLIKN
ncbi:MAG: T9SS type A sorting domain-containing protein [Bacteroidota bacterium]|nr:T9SS type A sorting domain-containing protein [Bacteroidota bacterium]